MDLETMPRRGRRVTALAGLVLAAAVTVAGCNGDGKTSSDSAAAGAASTTTSAGTTASPQAPADSATPPAATPPSDPASAPAASPSTGSSPGSAAPAPAQPSATTSPGTPPGIAVGEPDPAGTGARPAVSYRVDGSNQLTVYFFGGVCQQYALKADESHPGRVDVRIVVAAPMPPGQVCNALAKRQTVSADLRSPLAGRTVTDQSSGQNVPLEADPHMGPDPVTPDVAGQ
ncbi:hypothetical protein P3T27_001011 [Kitasatospora sp. MAA19]|uniref:hypothetical protein n=1 Tax=Kitasatospora sp. MAA19 TaxID=3035090 RepID=UPI00247414C6|nr:hypothetical protein [Kitasatospora sp. MAA19]MDH6704310.1 hypothetical protein [Kitasatospora sp. MAA19]